MSNAVGMTRRSWERVEREIWKQHPEIAKQIRRGLSQPDLDDGRIVLIIADKYLEEVRRLGKRMGSREPLRRGEVLLESELWRPGWRKSGPPIGGRRDLGIGELR